MKLYLIRHGQAEPGLPNDRSRQLTALGHAQAAAAGAWLAATLKQPATVWVSPFARTQQTAAAIAGALSTSIISQDVLIPDASPQAVVEALIERQQTMILVTHLPLVGRLATLLVDGSSHGRSWQPAEICELQGDVFAAGCLEMTQTWLPA